MKLWKSVLAEPTQPLSLGHTSPNPVGGLLSFRASWEGTGLNDYVRQCVGWVSGGRQVSQGRPSAVVKIVNMVQPVANFQKRLSVGSTQPPDGDSISFSSNHRRHGISHSAR